MNQMSKLETKESVEILLSEKKKAGYKLEKAYDSYCLLPNEHDKEDWDNYSALETALEMAVEALEKQIPKKVRITISTKRCSVCGRQLSGIGNIHPERNYCQGCGQKICWEGE